VKNILTRWLRPTHRELAWIEPAELHGRLKSTTAPLVVDVRGPQEFTGPLGHIERAVNTPLAALPARLPDLGRETREIVLVCKTDRRSSLGAQQMRDAGIANVSVLLGGMEEWRALGLPIQ